MEYIIGIIAIYFGVKIWNYLANAPKAGAGTSSVPSDYKEKLAKQGIGERRKSQKYLTIEKPDIELDKYSEKFLQLTNETNHNIFLTGRAGTGKSTLLRYLRATTEKNLVVVAPTGVAAINVQGQTIHSFFRFGIDITEDKVRRRYDSKSQIYRNLNTLVIDEISMVRADLFDCVEKFLRLNGPKPNTPFGGVQIIAIGDLYQLPPVVTNDQKSIFQSYYQSPFFFDAKSFSSGGFTTVELRQVYRQNDPEFIEILDAIRVSKASNEHIKKINTRVINDANEERKFNVSLVPTNAMANEINENELNKIEKEEKTYKGAINGAFKENELPTALELKLKEGAQVMLLNNDPSGKWVNGDLVRILKLDSSSVRVIFEDGSFDDVSVNQWDKINFIFDEEENRIKSEIVGSFIQLPMKLAWGITIHKSQGKTYDRVAIDFGRGTFAAGQAYVALSRCRTMEGLTLNTPLEKEHIFIDPKVAEFMRKKK